MTASVWRCGGFEFDLMRPLVMGIVNVTPDSFSDGGAHDAAPDAIAFAESLLDDGADIVDVGGESTRPGSSEVDAATELSRVIDVVRVLSQKGVCVSIDTRHAEVARACVDAGASIVNDVSGFRDPAMVEVAAATDAGLVVMHMAGEPKTMQEAPHYDDVVAEVGAYLRDQASMLESAGVERERICIDPGFGFGKTSQDNIRLIECGEAFTRWGYPLMVALSRKRTIGELYAPEGVASVPSGRVWGSVAMAVRAIDHGAAIARVHDVEQTVEAFSAWLQPSRRALIALGSNMGDTAGDKFADGDKPAVDDAPETGDKPAVDDAPETGQTLATDGAPAAREMGFTGPLNNLRRAKNAIAALPGTEIIAASSAYCSEPAYFEDQAPFANAVIEVTTRLHPRVLLAELQRIELAFGRHRTFPNAPRPIDLDILNYEGEVVISDDLVLPHPRILERDFVVTPLLEIAGFEGICLADGMPVTRDCVAYGKVTGKLGRL